MEVVGAGGAGRGDAVKTVIAGRAGGVELVVGGAICSGVSSLTGAGVSVMC